MLSDEEKTIFEAWLDECDDIVLIIRNHCNKNSGSAGNPALLLDKAISPYHYFRERFLEGRMLARSGKVDGAGTPAAGPAAAGTPDRTTAATPPAGAAPGSKGPVKDEKGPTPERGPETRPTKFVAVRVGGDTMPNIPMLKAWSLRWDPNSKKWWGSVPEHQLEDFKKAAAAKSMTVEATAG